MKNKRLAKRTAAKQLAPLKIPVVNEFGILRSHQVLRAQITSYKCEVTLWLTSLIHNIVMFFSNMFFLRSDLNTRLVSCLQIL